MYLIVPDSGMSMSDSWGLPDPSWEGQLDPSPVDLSAGSLAASGWFKWINSLCVVSLSEAPLTGEPAALQALCEPSCGGAL